jgi:hypothetical protein
MFLALAERHRFKNFFHVTVNVAGEQSRFLAILDKTLERATGFNNLGGKFVHLQVALIEQNDATLRIEHVQSLRHVVERSGQTTILLLQASIEDARGCEECNGGTRNQRDLTHGSGWQQETEHAGPQRIPPAIMCGSNCDIVNFCFLLVVSESRKFGWFVPRCRYCNRVSRVPVRSCPEKLTPSQG